MKNFSTRLIQWGKKKGRNELPWKKKTDEFLDPYKIWISEMMLQQTRLSAVMPKYYQFMQKFPDVERLAKSSLEEVIRVWVGLGYNSRARYLHKGAAIIVYDKGRVFPRNAIEWQDIPGVGRSTSAAISSFVNNEKVSLLDGNVIRILSRRYCLDYKDIPKGAKNLLVKLADRLLPENELEMPLYSQYIMDLGALICTPRKPLCKECPVSRDCKAFISQTVENYPSKQKRILKARQMTWVFAKDGEKVLLERQDENKLWRSLFLPAANLELKKHIRLPRKTFFRRYNIKVSNCNLNVDVWRRNCFFEMLNFGRNQRVVERNERNRLPIPKLLDDILNDSAFWK